MSVVRTIYERIAPWTSVVKRKLACASTSGDTREASTANTNTLAAAFGLDAAQEQQLYGEYLSRYGAWLQGGQALRSFYAI